MRPKNDILEKGRLKDLFFFVKGVIVMNVAEMIRSKGIKRLCSPLALDRFKSESCWNWAIYHCIDIAETYKDETRVVMEIEKFLMEMNELSTQAREFSIAKDAVEYVLDYILMPEY